MIDTTQIKRQSSTRYVKFQGYGGDKSYFFWMFESRSDPKNDPLVGGE
jgi:carboxypeptidase C (cathepsin A)